MALDKNSKIFMLYIATLEALISELLVYLDKTAKITFLFTKKVKILNKDTDFANNFSEKKTLILLKETNFNEYIIKLEGDKQSFHELIYSLELIELKKLKVYIKTNPKTGLI